MLKILHIFHDQKFIDFHIERFQESPYFNEYVYLDKEFAYNGKYLDILRKVKPFTEDYSVLISTASLYDIIFIYNLNKTKASLINSLEVKKPIIIWHFYGVEIYNRPRFKYENYSLATKKVLGIKSLTLLKESLRRNVRNLKYILKCILTGNMISLPKDVIEQAIAKIDFFAWYDVYEYKLLKSKMKRLPQFLYMPFIMKKANSIPVAELSPKTIIGNSYSPENNHLDILLLLQRHSFKNEIIVPFSYGNDEIYKLRLTKIIQSMNLNIRLLDKLMNYEEYLSLLKSCKVGIFNSYRQMALGNIVKLIINGSKIYLSKKNPTFYWLKKYGFYIYSIENELENDLITANLQVTENEIWHNQTLYEKLTDTAQNKDFIKNLQKLVAERTV